MLSLLIKSARKGDQAKNIEHATHGHQNILFIEEKTFDVDEHEEQTKLLSICENMTAL